MLDLPILVLVLTFGSVDKVVDEDVVAVNVDAVVDIITDGVVFTGDIAITEVSLEWFVGNSMLSGGLFVVLVVSAKVSVFQLMDPFVRTFVGDFVTKDTLTGFKSVSDLSGDVLRE